VSATYTIARFVFLRTLGICAAFAFVALWEQAPGLIGPNGISPLADIMAAWRRHGGFFDAPSLFWLSTGPWFVSAVALLGLLASVLLTAGVAPRLCCIVAYVAWLSFRAVDGGVVRWFNFPFDELQNEIFFLAIFVAPWVWSPRADTPPLPRWVRWLMLWFAFRALFGPGLAKVLYHPPWLEWTAIEQFLLTMPHPTAAAAWFRDLGSPWLEAMTAFTLVVELGCALLLFVPGRTRRIAAAIAIALMIGIQVVCNIRGFQPITIAVLLFAWDDDSLRRLVPERWRREITPQPPPAAPRWRTIAVALLFAFVVFASVRPTLEAFRVSLADLSPTAEAVAQRIEPFHIAAGYTMFCVMPSERLALVVQGSNDGETWLDYEPRHVPAAVGRTPTVFAPYHDYFGFRFWLAAFSPPVQDGWLRDLQRRLLDGEPTVEALFRNVPFDAPPQRIRIAMYRYAFAPPQERRTGTFWQRDFVLVRIPAASRQR